MFILFTSTFDTRSSHHYLLFKLLYWPANWLSYHENPLQTIFDTEALVIFLKCKFDHVIFVLKIQQCCSAPFWLSLWQDWEIPGHLEKHTSGCVWESICRGDWHTGQQTILKKLPGQLQTNGKEEEVGLQLQLSSAWAGVAFAAVTACISDSSFLKLPAWTHTSDSPGIFQSSSLRPELHS